MDTERTRTVGPHNIIDLFKTTVFVHIIFNTFVWQHNVSLLRSRAIRSIK